MTTTIVLKSSKHDAGTGVWLGTRPASVPATEISYHKMQVNVDDKSCSYILGTDGSGIYSTADWTITNFIDAVQNNTPLGSGQPLHDPDPIHNTAPSLVVKNPCFVVIKLVGVDSTGAPIALRFRIPYPVLTDVDHKSDYRWWQSSTNSEGFTDLIAFAAMHPQPAAAHVNDGYSLFLEYDQAPSTVKSVPIDPAIKNCGGA